MRGTLSTDHRPSPRERMRQVIATTAAHWWPRLVAARPIPEHQRPPAAPRRVAGFAR